MFATLGALVSRRPGTVLVCWAMLALGLKSVAPRWDDVTHDGDLAYLPAEVSSVRAERLLSAAFDSRDARSQLVVVAERPEGPLDDVDLEAVERLRDRLESLRGEAKPVSEIWSPADQVIGYQLTSQLDETRTVLGQAALIVLQVRNEFMATSNIALLADVRQIISDFAASQDAPEGLRLGVTGSAAIGGDMLTAALESVRRTEWMTVVLIFAILLAVYRAPLLVSIPLLTITVSVSVAMDLVALLTQVQLHPGWEWFDLKVFKTTKIFIVTILFGSGTDFCLFLISRYREELQSGRDAQASSGRALGYVGDALLGSALTTVLGLGTMYFADFGKYHNSGPVIALCLLVTLAACLTLAPALLRLLGRRVFWPFQEGLSTENAGSRNPRSSLLSAFWERASNWIIARPGLILVASVLLFAPLAWSGGDVQVTYDLLGELASDRPSVQGTRTLRRYYPAGNTGPIVIFLEQRTPNLVTLDEEGAARQLRRSSDRWVELTLTDLDAAPADARDVYLDRPVSQLDEDAAKRTYGQAVYASGARPLTPDELEKLRPGERAIFETDDGAAMVALLTKDLYDEVLQHDDGVVEVASVRSIAEPLGDWPGTPAGILTPTGRRKAAALQNPRMRAKYVATLGELAGRVTRLEVALTSDPFARESREHLALLESKLEALVTDQHSPWYGARFALGGATSATRDLAAVTESDRVLIQRLVVIAVLAVMILVLRQPWICLYLIATVLYSYFITIGAAELIFGWLYGPTYDGVDWKVPLFLFVILVAIGEDYNIYLVTRVFEEQRKHGPVEGLRRATAHTGGIISSCGVIMAGTFAAMMFGSLRGMIELGLALSLGVALDTFFVRPVLVPAFLALWHRWHIGRRTAEHDATAAPSSSSLVERPRTRAPLAGATAKDH